MLAISWQYLTGSAVATQVAARTEPEWPPHPDRVFQALVASWAERGQDAGERAALAWLEQLPAPDVAVPSDDLVAAAAARKVYVPVNDKSQDPAQRTRKERRFPSMVVGAEICSLRWPGADPAEHRDALARLVSGVPYLGHSSSLVRMWLDDAPPPSSWQPADERQAPDTFLRVAAPGRLAALVRDYADGGKAWRRPTIGAWTPYVRGAAPGEARGHHAGRMIVLRRIAGSQVSPLETLTLCGALRATLNRHAPSEQIRVLVSGHEPGGAALRSPHAAYVPLPFVGSTYADGHVLGVAVVLPHGAGFEEEDGLFAALAGASDPETATVTLTLAGGRTVVFSLEERPAPPHALRAVTWSRASRVWTSVTPIVLGRQAPRRHPDRDEFARQELVRSCADIGLPEPLEVRLLASAAVTGAPTAGQFPPLPTKRGLGRRQVHAWLRFAVPVGGPVLLGAGRYRGYGLLRPMSEGGDA
jgi:CRISPR-associated protein Csb2